MKLNALQQRVVEELKDNILLIASAGTGKTSTLAYRIAKIINSDLAKPEEILCLTFTNRACLEIKSKVEEIAGTEAINVVVRTFHSFCCDIVRLTAKKNADLFTDFVVFDEEDCKNFVMQLLNCSSEIAVEVQKFIKLIKEYIGLLGLYSEDKISNYQETINYVYINERLRLNNCLNNNAQLMSTLNAEGANIIADYDYMLNEAHGLDFDDLIIYANKVLQNPEVRESWQQRFKFINIDEVQDTNELEYKIISQVFGKSNLLLCGDPFQTIYEWRGSNPKQVEARYRQDYNPQVIVLDENYRATKTLLKASYNYLKKCFSNEVLAVYPNDIKVASDEVGDKIVLHQANKVYYEARWIYEQICNLNVTDLSKVCVLTRSNPYNKLLAGELFKVSQNSSRKIPFMLIDDFLFFRRQEIKDVIAFLRLAVNKHDGMSLERVLKRFSKGIGDTTIDSIISKESRKLGIRLTDFMDPSTHRFGEPYEELLRALEAENIVVFDVESTGLDTTVDEIVQIAAIRLNRDGSIKSKFNHLVKPTRAVGTSVAVHGITDENLAANGQDPREVFTEFMKFAEGAVLVGHNVNYDLNILTSQMSRLSMAPLEYKNYYDTLDIFRRFHPNLKNHRLETLGEEFEVSHKSTHDAYDDICATAEILMYAINNDIKPTQDSRRDFILKYLTKFTEAMKQMSHIRSKVDKLRPHDLMFEIIKIFGIKDYYEQHREDNRVKYLRDMYVLVKDIDEPEISTRDAIQRVLQYTSLSNTEIFLRNDKKIPVITVHQAKGMEFDYVFVAGLMEKTFPSYQSIMENKFDEETRLFYVAITRAKRKLFLSYYGHQISRYINYIPTDAIQRD